MSLCRDRFAPSCFVLLDDAAREGERAILLRWKLEFAVSFAIPASSSRAFVPCTVKGRG